MLHFRRCIPAISVRATRNYTAARFVFRVMRETDSIASFIYISITRTFSTITERRRARKNIRGVLSVFSRKGSFPKPSRVSLFLPSFLPSVVRYERPRGVYFLRLLHAHSIILYSFLHLTPRISLASLRHTQVSDLSPNIPCLYAILHGACKFNSPAHPHVFLVPSVPASPPPAVVSLSPFSSYRLRRFEIQTPGDW